MSASIFISFASKDRKVAESICNALERRGLKCWISCRDVMPGENFQESIVRAIRSAKLMVLVFSANANNSDEIKKELVLAGRSKLIVVPLRVEDVAPGDAFAYEFATRQWIDLFDDWERALEQLSSQVASALASHEASPAPEALTAEHIAADPALTPHVQASPALTPEANFHPVSAATEPETVSAVIRLGSTSKPAAAISCSWLSVVCSLVLTRA